MSEFKKFRGEFFPLLNAFGEAQWQSGRGVPHADIDELGEAAFAFVSRLQSRLDSLEKDAARYVKLPINEWQELEYWLDRCSDKGHLENCPDLIEPYENLCTAMIAMQSHQGDAQ